MSNELPILNQTNIPNPCPMSWDDMSGNDKTRHCSQCEKSVYHLSNMTGPEAAKVLREHGGDLCVHGVFRTSDGSLITKPTRKQRFHRLVRRTLATVLVVPMIAVLSGCGEQKFSGKLGEWIKPETPEAVDPTTGEMVMGGIVAIDAPATGKVALPESPPE